MKPIQKSEIQEFKEFVETLMIAYDNYRTKPLTKEQQIKNMNNIFKDLDLK